MKKLLTETEVWKKIEAEFAVAWNFNYVNVGIWTDLEYPGNVYPMWEIQYKTEWGSDGEYILYSEDEIEKIYSDMVARREEFEKAVREEESALLAQG